MEEYDQNRTRLKAVQNFEGPKKKKDVRAFLGLAGNYWKFIPRFSETAIPLTDATKKDAPDCTHLTLGVFLHHSAHTWNSLPPLSSHLV